MEEAKPFIFTTPQAYVEYDKSRGIAKIKAARSKLARITIRRLIVEKKIERIDTVIFRIDRDQKVTRLIRGKHLGRFLYPERIRPKPPATLKKKSFKELAEEKRKKPLPIIPTTIGPNLSRVVPDNQPWSATSMIDKILD